MMHGLSTSRWLPLLAAALLYLGLASHAMANDSKPPEQKAHIAVILPSLAGKSWSQAAKAVWEGAQAAEFALGDADSPKLRLYPTGTLEEEGLAAYQQALSEGAVGVIGPLNPTAMAKFEQADLRIPVLALSSLNSALPQTNLYALRLSSEDDARQLAERMYADGLRKPLLINGGGALAKRISDAFAQQWQHQSGNEPATLTPGSTSEAMQRLREHTLHLEADSYFLAADHARARMLRPYLASDKPVYATAQVWNGRLGAHAGFDLQGIRIVDMPWLLEPYQSQVLAFKRSKPQQDSNWERLYALGIDAYRVGRLLVVAAKDAQIELSGVTGELRMQSNHQFSRQSLPSEIGAEPRTPAPASAIEPLPQGQSH